ncbi:MAG: O-antigen polymerase [Qipengyuania sp.]
MYDILLAASVLVFLVTCLVYIRHPAASLHHPASFYLGFHGFLFVIRPILARIYDYDFIYRVYQFQPSLADKITVIVGANIALLTFVAVSLRIASLPVTPAQSHTFAKARKFAALPIALASVALLPISIWALLQNWQRRANVFDDMVIDAATGTATNSQAIGWLTEAGLMMAPLSVIIVWLARYRWWSWPVFLGFLVLQAGTGTRAPLIYAVTALIVLYLLEKRRAWPEWRSVVLAGLGALAFSQIVIDRGGAVRDLFADESESRYLDTREYSPFEHMDYGSLEYFEYLVFAVPQRTGSYDYFAHNLQIFTEPVPRVLWRDKPIGSPLQFFKLWDYGRPTGMTYSLPGAGWMSLGYLGIVIQAGFFAMLFAVFYNRTLIYRDSAMARMLFALVIAMAPLVFRDGILLTFLRNLPFFVGPFVAIYLLARFSGLGRAPDAPGWSAAPLRDDLSAPAERRRMLAAQADVAR